MSELRQRQNRQVANSLADSPAYPSSPEHTSDKAWMKTEVMIEANTTNSAH